MNFSCILQILDSLEKTNATEFVFSFAVRKLKIVKCSTCLEKREKLKIEKY